MPATQMVVNPSPTQHYLEVMEFDTLNELNDALCEYGVMHTAQRHPYQSYWMFTLPNEKLVRRVKTPLTGWHVVELDERSYETDYETAARDVRHADEDRFGSSEGGSRVGSAYVK